MRALSIGPGAAEAIPAQGRRPVIIKETNQPARYIRHISIFRTQDKPFNQVKF